MGWGRAEAGRAVGARSPRALQCCARLLGFVLCARLLDDAHILLPSHVQDGMAAGASQMDVFGQ